MHNKKQTNYKWLVTITMGLAVVILCVDWTIVSIALPTISEKLHASLSSLQWILNAYALTSAMFMILGGRLADIYGKKRMFIWGIAIFTVSVAMGGFAPNENILIFSRAIQGIGAAIALPISIVFIFNAFPKNQRGLAIGIVGGIAGFSLAAGPTLGGIVLHWLSWRWVFFVNVPIAILCILMTLKLIKKDEPSTTKEPIDFIGAAILALGLLGIVLALNKIEDWGASTRFWIFFVGGLIALILFIWIEHLRKSPLINTELFYNKRFILINIIRACVQFVFASFGFVLVLYLQNIVGFSPMKSGLLMLFLTLIFGFTAPFSGQLVDIFGSVRLLTIGLILTAISSITLYRLTISPTIVSIAIAFFITGLGVSFCMPGATTTALSSLPEKDANVGTGIFYTTAFASASIGIAISGYILAKLAIFKFHQALHHTAIHFSAINWQWLSQAATGTDPVKGLSRHFTKATYQQLAPIAQQAFMSAYHMIMLLSLGLIIFALVLTLILNKTPKPNNAS